MQLNTIYTNSKQIFFLSCLCISSKYYFFKFLNSTVYATSWVFNHHDYKAMINSYIDCTNKIPIENINRNLTICSKSYAADATVKLLNIMALELL